jgi:transcriptional repressor of cell division inhibition gene dicB
MLKKDVLSHFGSVKATCKAIGITRSAVSQWKEIIPQGCAYKVQFITGGRLQVNPTLYPPKKFKPVQMSEVA